MKKKFKKVIASTPHKKVEFKYGKPFVATLNRKKLSKYMQQKTKSIILFLLTIFILSGCTNKDLYKIRYNSEYHSDGNSVYIDTDYQVNSGRVSFNTKKIKGADPDTFQIIDNRYTKDKNYVFIYGKKIKEADPQTFKVINGSCSKDKNNIYLFGEIINIKDIGGQNSETYCKNRI